MITSMSENKVCAHFHEYYAFMAGIELMDLLFYRLLIQEPTAPKDRVSRAGNM